MGRFYQVVDRIRTNGIDKVDQYLQYENCEK